MGSDTENTVFNLKSFEGAEVVISPKSKDGLVRWLGEMNVIGQTGFVYGDGILAIDDAGIALRFTGLKKGKYRLKTYHHAPKSNSDVMDPNKEKLKKIQILNIPYENELTVSTSSTSQKVRVTEGKNMQFERPGTAVVEFEIVDGKPYEILFKGSSGKGIWLNGFELQEWK